MSRTRSESPSTTPRKAFLKLWRATPAHFRVAPMVLNTNNRDHVVMEVGRTTGIEITPEVGQLTEVINVTAEAAALETQTASRVGVVNSLQVAELPLNARNPFMLGTMMSGVVFRGAAIWQRPFDNGAIARWSVNGGRESNNEFMMDGAPNNGQAGNNNIAYVPIDLPGNVYILKDPKTQNADWKAYRVRGFEPCTQRILSSGASQMLNCQAGESPFFLMSPSYAPRFTPYRSGQNHAFTAEASVNKTRQIQFGIKAYW